MANTGNGVYIWDEDHNDWENIGTAIGSKGEKGDPSTVPGPAGQPGVTPVISANASVDSNTGTPSVTVTKSGTDAAPTFAFDFHNLKGRDGQDGADSTVPGPQGPPGESIVGPSGQDGITPQVSATASITENGGNPAVYVTRSGTDATPTFAFDFRNLKGSDGIPGTDGQSIVGPTGPAGVTPNVTINASVDNTSGTPSVVVTKTGSDENPTFSLDFSGLKGRDGQDGQDGQSIVGPAGQPGRDGYAISWKVRQYEIDATLGRFWLTSIYFWDDPTLSHDVGQFIYGSTNTSSYFGRIDGFGTYNGTSNVPYVLFENLTQVVSAQGAPGKSILPTNIVFDNLTVTPATVSYANNNYIPTPGDSILDSTNTYIATVTSTDPQAQTAVINNIKRIGGPGTVGPTPNINVTASVSDTVGTPNVQVRRSGTPENPVIDFAFSGIKGQNGISPALPNISATATVDNTVGTPSVVVTKSGTNANPNFNFSFNRIKGESGLDGKNQGYWHYIYSIGTDTTVNEAALYRGSTGGYDNVEVGDVIYTMDGYIAIVKSISNHVCTIGDKILLKGDDGDTPTISATASVDSNIGTPSVSVTKSGTDIAPTFAFNFRNLKGERGPQGPPLDSSLYYTKAQVDALFSNYSGGGWGTVIHRGEVSLANIIIIQMNGGSPYASCTIPFIVPPKTPAPWYVGKTCYIVPYYVSWPTNLVNIQTKADYNENHTVSPVNYPAGLGLIYKNGIQPTILSTTVGYGGRVDGSILVFANLIDYDEVLPTWNKKYGTCSCTIKYSIIVPNDN